MTNLSNFINLDSKKENIERKQLFLSEIKMRRNQYERLLVEFLHEFVLEGKPLSDSYVIAYEELLETTQGGRLPSSLCIFEYMVFSEDTLPYDPNYEKCH